MKVFYTECQNQQKCGIGWSWSEDDESFDGKKLTPGQIEHKKNFCALCGHAAKTTVEELPSVTSPLDFYNSRNEFKEIIEQFAKGKLKQNKVNFLTENISGVEVIVSSEHFSVIMGLRKFIEEENILPVRELVVDHQSPKRMVGFFSEEDAEKIKSWLYQKAITMG